MYVFFNYLQNFQEFLINFWIPLFWIFWCKIFVIVLNFVHYAFKRATFQVFHADFSPNVNFFSFKICPPKNYRNPRTQSHMVKSKFPFFHSGTRSFWANHQTKILLFKQISDKLYKIIPLGTINSYPA